MEHTRVACLRCGRPAPRNAAIRCEGCELVFYCGRQCQALNSEIHRLACESAGARFRALSDDGKFRWHLNSSLVRNFIWPAFVQASARLSRPLRIPADRVLLFHFDGSLRGFPPDAIRVLTDAIAQHLWVRMAWLFGQFERLNGVICKDVEGYEVHQFFSLPALRVRLVTEREAEALIVRDIAHMDTSRRTWLGSPKARMAIASSIDGRLESTRATMALIEQPR